MGLKQFEGRELKPFAQPVSPRDLKVASVYFFVNYQDDAMLIPTLQPMVFVGKDFEPTDSRVLYFQDVESYQRGVRYETTVDGDEAVFYCGSQDEAKDVFDYERALEELMRCSLRRRGMSMY